MTILKDRNGEFPMKTALLIVAGAAALSLAACNKPATETATDTAMEATPAPVSDGGSSDSAAASTGAMTSANGATSTTSRSAGSETLSPAAGSTTTPMSPMSPATTAPPTSQETIAATKDTLSPGGASSGATAPAPKH